MAINQILNIFEWAIVGSVGTASAATKKLYPKSTDAFWYSVDDAGFEKQFSYFTYNFNGLNYTPYGASNPYGGKLDVVLGGGLTFSGNFAGSSIEVFGVTAGNLKSVNTATAGYVLTATSSGFEWLPFTAPGVNGTTNYIPKFTTPTSIGNSILTEDGTNLYLGTTPSFQISKLNVDGNITLTGSVYFRDNSSGAHINSSGTDNLNVVFRNDFAKFSIDYPSSFNALTIDKFAAGISFSFNNGMFIIGSQSSQTIDGPRINSISFGSTTSNLVTLLTSSSSGVLRLVDSTQALNKVFVSDANGLGTWQYLVGGSGITISGITISGSITGNGLTYSSGAIALNYGIFGISLTHSAGVVNLPTTGISAGTYGSSASIPVLQVDVYGRVVGITTSSINNSGLGYIDSPYDKNWVANSVTSGGETASSSTISSTPAVGSYVTVFVNGQEMEVGNATTSAACYFGTNSITPKGFSVSNAITSGDYLYWNPSIAGYDLEAGFRISLHYLISP